jgi:hypothetical protein
VQRRLLPHHSNTATPLSVGLSTADLPLEEERKNSKPKGRKTVENRSKRGKEKTKIKLTVCGVCLALQVTLFSPPARKGRGEEVVADPLFVWIFRRRRVEKTCRHCSGDPKVLQRVVPVAWSFQHCSRGFSFVIFSRGCVFSDYFYLIILNSCHFVICKCVCMRKTYQKRGVCLYFISVIKL